MKLSCRGLLLLSIFQDFSRTVPGYTPTLILCLNGLKRPFSTAVHLYIDTEYFYVYTEDRQRRWLLINSQCHRLTLFN